jgi:hypothetical protein
VATASPAREVDGAQEGIPRLMTKAPGAPSLGLLATEAPRAALDLAALLATWPVLTTAPGGDGHHVLVLPGLLTGDPATVLLRNVLRLLGHRSAGGASARTGPYRRVVGALRDRLDRLHQESGRRVASLAGASAASRGGAGAGLARQRANPGRPGQPGGG